MYLGTITVTSLTGNDHVLASWGCTINKNGHCVS